MELYSNPVFTYRRFGSVPTASDTIFSYNNKIETNIGYYIRNSSGHLYLSLIIRQYLSENKTYKHTGSQTHSFGFKSILYHISSGTYEPARKEVDHFVKRGRFTFTLMIAKPSEAYGIGNRNHTHHTIRCCTVSIRLLRFQNFSRNSPVRTISKLIEFRSLVPSRIERFTTDNILPGANRKFFIFLSAGRFRYHYSMPSRG